MKKRILTPALILSMLVALLLLSACGNGDTTDPTPTPDDTAVTTDPAPTPTDTADASDPDESPEEDFVRGEFTTVTDLRGDVVSGVPVNPEVIAVYCWSVLDILYRAGFENTGIELILVPSKETMPDQLVFFRDAPDSLVVNAGTMHWVDWDMLDFARYGPGLDLVITGQRSFGMDHNLERLDADGMEELRDETFARYDGTAFIHLGISGDHDQLGNVEVIVEALAAIFPNIADYLITTYDGFEAQVNEIRDGVEATDANALVVTLHSPYEFSLDVGAMRGGRNNVLFDLFGFQTVELSDDDAELTGAGDASTELVLRIDPDVIFILPHSALTDPTAAVNNFMSDAVIGLTQAFQNDNIILLQQAPWHTLNTGFTGMEGMIHDVGLFLIG